MITQIDLLEHSQRIEKYLFKNITEYSIIIKEYRYAFIRYTDSNN